MPTLSEDHSLAVVAQKNRHREPAPRGSLDGFCVTPASAVSCFGFRANLTGSDVLGSALLFSVFVFYHRDRDEKQHVRR
jgi:hypothetical protein